MPGTPGQPGRSTAVSEENTTASQLVGGAKVPTTHGSAAGTDWPIPTENKSQEIYACFPYIKKTLDVGVAGRRKISEQRLASAGCIEILKE